MYNHFLILFRAAPLFITCKTSLEQSLNSFPVDRCKIIAAPSCMHDNMGPSLPDSASIPNLIVSLAMSVAFTFDSILSLVFFLVISLGISTALDD